jgi:hypothetical protein
MSNIDKRDDSVSRIIADLKLKHGTVDTYAPIIRWDELLALLDELEVVNGLFLRAKALIYQSGGTPIENSLNPIDAWLYDAERAAAAGKGEAS